jgi:hypothetical protein
MDHQEGSNFSGEESDTSSMKIEDFSSRSKRPSRSRKEEVKSKSPSSRQFIDFDIKTCSSYESVDEDRSSMVIG